MGHGTATPKDGFPATPRIPTWAPGNLGRKINSYRGSTRNLVSFLTEVSILTAFKERVIFRITYIYIIYYLYQSLRVSSHLSLFFSPATSFHLPFTIRVANCHRQKRPRFKGGTSTSTIAGDPTNDPPNLAESNYLLTPTSPTRFQAMMMLRYNIFDFRRMLFLLYWFVIFVVIWCVSVWCEWITSFYQCDLII